MRARPPIFCIGMNRTGTSSLHHLFTGSGLRSATYRGPTGRHLAKQLFANFSAGDPLLTGLEEIDAFSDLVYISYTVHLDGVFLFEQMHREHPDAYFILNTRPMDRWIASRLAHSGGGGDRLVECFASTYGLPEDAVPELWKRQRTQHHRNVERYFSDRGGRLRVFDIETDPVGVIADFLAPDYEIDASKWGESNSGKDRKRTQRFRLEKYIVPRLRKLLED